MRRVDVLADPRSRVDERHLAVRHSLGETSEEASGLRDRRLVEPEWTGCAVPPAPLEPVTRELVIVIARRHGDRSAVERLAQRVEECPSALEDPADRQLAQLEHVAEQHQSIDPPDRREQPLAGLGMAQRVGAGGAAEVEVGDDCRPHGAHLGTGGVTTGRQNASVDQSPKAEQVGIRGYPGPFPVGRYADALRARLRALARVCVVGEVSGWRIGAGPNIYFELRDPDGALPCAMWRSDFDRLGLRPEDFGDGIEVVAAGGCDYYPGGPSASPRFTFRVVDLRPAGEGDLLARLDRLRRQLAADGVTELQRRLPRPVLPRAIGVVTAEHGAARRDLLAALERRGWRGRIVWGYAPVQDRRAAPAIAAAIRDLAAVAEVETIVVTRGGGSIADLWAFCDEALCRTVALLPVPVISAVGHEVDRTLLDDVAARLLLDADPRCRGCRGAWTARRPRAGLRFAAGRLDALARAALLGRRAGARRSVAGAARTRGRHRARAPSGHARAAGGRRDGGWRSGATSSAASRRPCSSASSARRPRARPRHGRPLRRRGHAARAGGRPRSRSAGRRRSSATSRRCARHDPERTLERGYALVSDRDGELLDSAAAARGGATLRPADVATATFRPSVRRLGRRMPTERDLTYEAAVERLEQIIARLDSNETELRETLELCREGKGLIEFAAGELEAVGKGLEELRLDDLVARLDGAAAQPG